MALAGRVVIEDIESVALRGNPLNDPSTRRIPVYLPPGYDEGTRRYPVVYWLHGFTGAAVGQLYFGPWVLSVPEAADRVIRDGAPPAIVVMPDGWTTYGGSQFLNSSANGRYEDAVRELTGVIDAKYRTLASREHRGISGKSSGGYGAVILGMRHPDVFGGIACHSGDIYFEACYRIFFWDAVDTIRRHGGLGAFLEAFRQSPKKTEAMVRTLGTTVAMAMAYSPNPRSPHGFDLPVDLETGRLNDEVWARWLSWDPAHVVDQHADALRAMRMIYLDCGSRDQFHSHHGHRILHERLTRLAISHEYHEFDDDHSATNYRYVESFRRLFQSLQR